MKELRHDWYLILLFVVEDRIPIWKKADIPPQKMARLALNQICPLPSCRGFKTIMERSGINPYRQKRINNIWAQLSGMAQENPQYLIELNKDCERRFILGNQGRIHARHLLNELSEECQEAIVSTLLQGNKTKTRCLQTQTV